jgi:hypothetical protein
VLTVVSKIIDKTMDQMTRVMCDMTFVWYAENDTLSEEKKG